jgi:hypothetical protein
MNGCRWSCACAVCARVRVIILGVGLSDHGDEVAEGVASHDGVVDDDHALVAQVLHQRIELEPDRALPLRLVRLHIQEGKLERRHTTHAAHTSERCECVPR